ncbi:hypothetical protein [Caballeronia telluris]|uniref:Uncharacterized protein n=1 Tax=Caballeronia telluris TaxID=326475 RepID=A0A158KIG9_9BURK|nr:hypothetical protein [Caballeronia telluris]SAL80948.1 hypothetical protein AWB66_06345 [Caballeronia telluris]
MTTVYVVKTGSQFLCTAEDGDMGLAPAVEEALPFCGFRRW